MRRYLQLLPLILFPHAILFVLLCMLTESFMRTFAPNDGSYLFLALIILYVAALVCTVAVFIISLVKKRDALEILRINMVIKLIHIPAYLLVFLVGLVCLITIFTIGISIVLMILDCLTILLTGLIGLGGIIRSFHENKLTKKSAVIHGILQFVFCADVISSIIIYRGVKTAVLDYKQC